MGLTTWEEALNGMIYKCLSVNEIEKEITQNEYDKLKLNSHYNSIKR